MRSARCSRSAWPAALRRQRGPSILPFRPTRPMCPWPRRHHCRTPRARHERTPTPEPRPACWMGPDSVADPAPDPSCSSRDEALHRVSIRSRLRGTESPRCVTHWHRPVGRCYRHDSAPPCGRSNSRSRRESWSNRVSSSAARSESIWAERRISSSKRTHPSSPGSSMQRASAGALLHLSNDHLDATQGRPDDWHREAHQLVTSAK